jgi:hypothetical protein
LPEDDQGDSEQVDCEVPKFVEPSSPKVSEFVRRWSPGMQLLTLSLSSVPVWINLHNLPLEFWNATCLSHFASGVGIPICVNSVTEEQRRLGFARVLVEVAVESEFPKEIDVVDLNDRIIKIGVEYPWVPIKCKKCSFFGHATHTCSKTEKAVWVPRKQEQKKDFISKALVKERFDGVSKPGPSGVDKWTVVVPKKPLNLILLQLITVLD